VFLFFHAGRFVTASHKTSITVFINRNDFCTMNLNVKFCFFLPLFFTVQLFGQKYSFENFTSENGLSSSQVLCMHQDTKDQTLWLGTNNGGINIFDGKSFQNLTKQKGLPDNTIFDIKEYGTKKYISTNNGLAIYDGKNYQILLPQDGLKHERVYCTFQDSKGTVWVATHGGLHIYDGKIQSFDKDSILAKNPVFNIYEDASGNIWFCTLFNGLIKYNQKTFKQYVFVEEKEHVDNFVSAILEIEPNKYWVLNRTGLFELRNDKLSVVDIPSCRLFHIFKDSHQNVWIGSDMGAIKYANSKFTYYNTTNGLVDNMVWRIMEDNEHNLWFASNENGFSKLESEAFINYTNDNGLPSNSVYVINEFEKGKLWIGTDSGMVKFDNGKITDKISFNGNNKLRLDNEIYDIAPFNDRLYVATAFGVGAILNGEIIEYLPKEPLENARSLAKCWTVFPENSNNIWLGTQGGICKIIDNKIQYWQHAGNIKDHVFDIKKTADGSIWFATESGLLHFKSNKLSHYGKNNGFTNKRVRAIAQDRNGVLWFATNEGIYTFFKNKFQRINFLNGKVDAVFSIACDSKNNIWAGLANGVLKIPADTLKNNILFFGAEDGFLGKECNNNAIFVDANDEVWIGTKRGLTIFRQYNFNPEVIIPSLQINSVKLFHNDVDWQFYTSSFSANGLPLDLELPFQQNHITFIFKAVSLKNSEKLNYRYKLEGYDKDWIYTKEASAVYSSLEPGSYEFIVQVSLDGVNWSSPANVFEFSITPPFWQSSWFYLLCVLIVLSWIYSYYRIQQSNKKLSRQKLLITEQNQTLEHKNKAIIDSIKYAKRIQNSILPRKKFVESELREYFISYLPKDIVSGDFYWVEKADNKLYFAVADCTGHGVPGAMVSIMCKGLLTQVVKEMKIKSPANILDITSSLLVNKMLDSDEENVNDGMDIALCSIDFTTMKLEYSGANNNLYLFRDGNIHVYRATKQPVGRYDYVMPFENHVIDVQKGDLVYLFSDGYADQFGGDNNKKFMSKRFRDLLISIASKDVIIQKEILEEEFHRWKGNNDQVDDVCVMGVRI